MYVQRGIEKTVLSNTSPVVIVEGARAVGKTRFARKLIEMGEYSSYVSLADPGTLQIARADISGWLQSLRRPAIIDEAQLVRTLPLALKELVDSLTPDRHFLLTGSASIGRSGLGGADPLVGRGRRFIMHPLSTSEVNARSGPGDSLVDQLFDHTPVIGTQSSIADETLHSMLMRGGFPGYVIPPNPLTERGLRAQIRSDVEATLGSHVLDGERFDSYRAKAILDGLLRCPGGILNVSSLGAELELDRRTVDRYLDVLQGRFLIHDLPNMAIRPRRQGRTNSKIHPVDTALCVESLLRAGRDFRSGREMFGQLLESHTVNQILASAQWAIIETNAFYWRSAKDRGSPEVDLVLRDDGGRHLGVEIKASRKIDPSTDLKGLRILHDRIGLHRGFVVYTGDEVMRLAENFWALPVGALGTAAMFEKVPESSDEDQKMRVTKETTDRTEDFDASLVLSYVHADDAYLKGAMTRFAADLRDSYSYLFGTSLRLFTDRTDIIWGEQWEDRVEYEIDNSTHLLAMITPRYLKSEQCRKEFTRFNTAARKAGESRLVLSIMWTEIAETSAVANDPVFDAIMERQYQDGADIGSLSPGTTEYRARVEALAHRLNKAINFHGVLRQSNPPDSAVMPDTDDNRDIVEIIEEFEVLGDDFQRATTDFQQAFQDVLAVLGNLPDLGITQPSHLDSRFADIGRLIEEPVRRLEKSSDSLAQVWRRFDSLLVSFTRMASVAPGRTVDDLRQMLVTMDSGLHLSGIDEMRSQVAGLGQVSRHLRPTSRVLTSAVDVMIGIRNSAGSWKDLLRK